ncbi:MAG: hypothetical protein GY821_12525 [Gammaproteobacteria bacterium]|nr:hypothetical protein [Gammaproteobacteria bacterium]
MEKTELIIKSITNKGELIYTNKINQGYLHFEKVKFSDLPNKDIKIDDLERFGLKINCGHSITLIRN